jgi:hypothetical protein
MSKVKECLEAAPRKPGQGFPLFGEIRTTFEADCFYVAAEHGDS